MCVLNQEHHYGQGHTTDVLVYLFILVGQCIIRSGGFHLASQKPLSGKFSESLRSWYQSWAELFVTATEEEQQAVDHAFFFLIRLAQNPAAKPAGLINGSQICLKTQWEECVLQKQEAIYIWRAPSYMRPPVQVSGYFSWLSWFSPWLRTNPHLLALFFRDEGYPGLERPLGLIKPYKRPASSLRRLLA